MVPAAGAVSAAGSVPIAAVGKGSKTPLGKVPFSQGPHMARLIVHIVNYFHILLMLPHLIEQHATAYIPVEHEGCRVNATPAYMA